jgi:hypothetical protein
MTKVSPSQEQRCPACGGKFTVTAPAKKKKIQCPRCRAIVSPASSSLFMQNEDAGSDSASAPEPEWKTQCEQLRARIERLENDMESLLRAPPPKPRDPKEPISHGSAAAAGELHGGRYAVSPVSEFSFPPAVTERARPPNESASFGPPRQSAGSKQLEEICLTTTSDDAGTVRVVEMLTAILTDAGWKVRRGTHVGNGAGTSPGLTLIASPALCRERLSRAFTALSAVGFALTLHLDQNRRPNETMLFVGHNVEYRPEDARGSEARAVAEVA